MKYFEIIEQKKKTIGLTLIKEIRKATDETMDALEKACPFKVLGYYTTSSPFHLNARIAKIVPEDNKLLNLPPIGFKRSIHGNAVCLKPDKRTKIGKSVAKIIDKQKGISSWRVPEALEFSLHKNETRAPYIVLANDSKVFLILDDVYTKDELSEEFFKEVTQSLFKESFQEK